MYPTTLGVPAELLDQIKKLKEELDALAASRDQVRDIIIASGFSVTIYILT